MTRRLGEIAAFLLLFTLAACGCDRQASSGDEKDFTDAALAESEMLRFFSLGHPQVSILKYAEADLDNDRQKDLIVIYRQTEDENRMCVIRHAGVGFIESNSVPAPATDQVIRLKDIDGKPPMEFIVQGRKGAKVGYAIFRLEQGTLADLFGEGMEDCC